MAYKDGLNRVTLSVSGLLGKLCVVPAWALPVPVLGLLCHGPKSPRFIQLVPA
jgi:hypothetical protein